MTFDLAGVEPEVGYDELDRILSRVVGEDGYVYIELLCEQPILPVDEQPASQPASQPSDIYTPAACALRAQLERQVRRLAAAGPMLTPELFPTRADRLTYWYNARTAWAIRLLLAAWDHRQATRRDPGTPAEAFIPFSRRRFQIDGGLMTLEGIDEAIAREGGPLAVMVAPGLDLRRASLPREAFRAAGLFDALPQRLTGFVNDERRFVVDILNQRVLVPPVIWQYRDQLLSRHRRNYGVKGATLTTALLPLVGPAAQRRLQNAIGYRCVPDRRERYAIVSGD